MGKLPLLSGQEAIGKMSISKAFCISRRGVRQSLARNKKAVRGLVSLVVISGIFITVFTLARHVQAQEEFDWRNDWTVKRGYTIKVDTEGYQLPTAIAFVPNPGNGPKDPLYFVAELKGTVKVITNDRSVHTFAEDFFDLGRVEAYGAEDSRELGMAGICLDPPRGYVFVTFVYQDSQRVLRNNVVRFESIPDIFALEPKSKVEFREIFSSRLHVMP